MQRISRRKGAEADRTVGIPGTALLEFANPGLVFCQTKLTVLRSSRCVEADIARGGSDDGLVAVEDD